MDNNLTYRARSASPSGRHLRLAVIKMLGLAALIIAGLMIAANHLTGWPN